MTMLKFDSNRDCSRKDTVQDIRVSTHAGHLAIEQWDGAGEEYHFVVVPSHLTVQFREAINKSLSTGESVTLDALPPKELSELFAEEETTLLDEADRSAKAHD